MTSTGASSGAVFATSPNAASHEMAKSATASHCPDVGETAACRAERALSARIVDLLAMMYPGNAAHDPWAALSYGP